MPKDQSASPGAESVWAKRIFPWLPTNWALANDGSKVVTTAFALAPVTAMQTGFQTGAQMNMRLPIAGILMKTFGDNVKMHTSRGAVSVTGKGHTRVDEHNKLEHNGLPRWVSTLTWTLADDIASTPFSARGKLRAAGILPEGYKSPNFLTMFRNYGQTMAVGTPLRAVIGFSNLSFLFYGADYFTGKFTFNSELFNNMLGGMTAGAGAALTTGALKGVYDDQLQKTTLSEDGRLKTMNSFRFFKHHVKQAASVPIKKLFYKAATRAVSDIAHTGSRNVLIFGTIQTVLYVLGPKPLANVVPEPTVHEQENTGTPASTHTEEPTVHEQGNTTTPSSTHTEEPYSTEQEQDERPTYSAKR